jgi:putative membrane protein
MYSSQVSALPWDGWGHMGGWGWLWGSLMMLFWIGVIGLLIWLVVRSVAGPAPGFRAAAPPVPPAPPERSGLDRARDILSERYARGEISTEEYQDRLAHLGQSG